MRFARLHGLGNDYLVMREAELTLELTPARIRAICDRHFGVGSDGILVETASHRAHIGLRILNPDGSEAEKSGNGLRIFGRFLSLRGRLKDRIEVETLGGIARIERLADDRLRVEMGRATFDSRALPAAGEPREMVAETVALGDETLQVTGVSVGNPHCVVFGERFYHDDLMRIGPLLESHPLFVQRTNVQLVEVRSPHEIFLRIFERGAGHTLASGSSASAAAAAAVRLGLAQSPITAHMEGGDLDVEVDPVTFEVVQTGPAEEICTGELSADFVTRLRAL